MTLFNVLLRSLILTLQLILLEGSLNGAGGESLLIFNSWRGKRAVHLSSDPGDPCRIYGNGLVAIVEYWSSATWSRDWNGILETLGKNIESSNCWMMLKLFETVCPTSSSRTAGATGTPRRSTLERWMKPNGSECSTNATAWNRRWLDTRHRLTSSSFIQVIFSLIESRAAGGTGSVWLC